MRWILLLLFFGIFEGMSIPAECVSIVGTMDQAKQLMVEKKWEDALEIIDVLIDELSDSTGNPTFAVCYAYYHKGYCEAELERWKDAARSFKYCYKELTEYREWLKNGRR